MKFLNLINTRFQRFSSDAELVNFYAPENLTIYVENLKYNNCDFSFVKNISDVTPTTTGINWMQFKNLTTATKVNFIGEDFYFPVLTKINSGWFYFSNTINSFYAPVLTDILASGINSTLSFGNSQARNITVKDVYAPFVNLTLQQNTKSFNNVNASSITGKNINCNFSNVSTLTNIVSQNVNYRGNTIDNCKIRFSSNYANTSAFSTTITSITNSEISGFGSGMFRFCLPNLDGTTVHAQAATDYMFYSQRLLQNEDYFKNFTFENIGTYNSMFNYCTSLQEISYEFLYNLFSNSKTNSYINMMFSYCVNLSNNSVKNIVRALIDSNISVQSAYKNLSNANYVSPFRYTLFDNSYYTEYHQELNNLGWKF
ncbi:hypothetical protein IJG14_01710 [bacterium]|nr:hypothetical protein [bacterium]